MARLDKDFFNRDTVEVARDLLGRYLVRSLNGETVVCRITETEAYVGAIDKACHAYGGRMTNRTRTLYAAPGTSYVYLIYGMYHCLNLVTEPEGTAAAVLIRGCTPVFNRDLVANLRFGVSQSEMSAYQRKNFMNGPGKVCKGLCIDQHCNGLAVDNNHLYVCDEIPELGLPCRSNDLCFETGTRIGIDYAEEAVHFPWRFWIKEDWSC